MLPSLTHLASAWAAGSAGWDVPKRVRECLAGTASLRGGAAPLTGVLVTAAKAWPLLSSLEEVEVC